MSKRLGSRYKKIKKLYDSNPEIRKLEKEYNQLADRVNKKDRILKKYILQEIAKRKRV